MKIDKIIVVVCAVLLVYWFIGGPESIVTDRSDAQNQQPKHMKKSDQITQHPIINEKKHKAVQQQHIAAFLQTPDDWQLEDNWLEEYGCFRMSKEAEGACAQAYMRALFYEEALWMKNNGFPTMSMLNSVNQPVYESQLNDKIEKKYPPALAVSALAALEQGDTERGLQLATSYMTYGDHTKTFGHWLYGRALFANGDHNAAAMHFFVAGIMGDYLSHGRAVGVSGNPHVMAENMNAAYAYLRKRYGSHYPQDPRPKIRDNGH